MKTLTGSCLASLIALIGVSTVSAQQELGTLSVVVRDESGKAVPGATVQCVSWNEFFPRTAPLTPQEQATTDAEGRAVFENVTVGQAFAYVTAGELGGWFRVHEPGPDVPLTIGVGHSTQIIVRDKAGNPIPDVMASADGCIPFGVTDKDGLVIIHHHGVPYTPQLYFAKAGYAWKSTGLPFNPANVFIVLEKGTVVEVNLLGPDGQPVPETEVWWNSQRMMRSDAQGRVRFPEVAEGSKANLTVSMRNRKPALSGETTVTVGPPPEQKVTISLEPVPAPPPGKPGVTIHGKVVHTKTGAPVKAHILFDRSQSFLGAPEIAATDDQGLFSAEIEDGDQGWIAAMPEDATLCTVGGLVAVDIEKAQADGVTIKVDAGCALRGRVVEDDGTPVKYAQVMVTPTGPYHRELRTDEQGGFEVRSLDKADLVYTVSARDELKREASVEVGPMAKGEIRDGIELKMPKKIVPAQLRGVVVDSDGTPAPNVNLYFHYQAPGGEPSLLDASSDDRGAFSTSILRSGTVKVGAHTVTQLEEGRNNLSTNCPVVEGNTFDLTEGTDQEVRIVVKRESLRILAGNVVDEEGKPIEAEVNLVQGEYDRDGIGADGDKTFFAQRLPEKAYFLEVTCPEYQARALFPGTDFAEGDQNLTITLKRGPFPVGTSVWEAVTRRPATKESVDSTPLADILRRRERDYFRQALPPSRLKAAKEAAAKAASAAVTPSKPTPAPPPAPAPVYAPKMRIINTNGQPVPHILLQTLHIPNSEKASLLPDKPGTQQPVSSPDGIYPIPIDNGGCGCIVSAPGLACVPVMAWGVMTDEPQTVVLAEPGTIEFQIDGDNNRPVPGAPIWLAQAGWEGSANEMYTFLTKTDEQGQAVLADIRPGVHSFAVGTYQQDMQVVTTVLKSRETRKVRVTLEKREGSRNPLVLMQMWREARRPAANYPSYMDEEWMKEIGDLPQSVRSTLAKTLNDSIFAIQPILAREQRESGEAKLLLCLAVALRDKTAAKTLQDLFAETSVGSNGCFAFSISIESAVTSAIADIEGDDAVGFFEECARDTKRPYAGRLAALFALGRLGSEKSAAAYARLRDAAYGQPGAPAKRTTYTHAQRMFEAAVMTLSVLPGNSKTLGVTLPQEAPTGGCTVSEDYKTGDFWLNNVHFQLKRVGSEWLVSSAEHGPVP